MTNYVIFALVLSALAVPLASAQSQRQGNGDAAIRKLEQEFAAAISAGDLDRALSFLTPDCVFLIDQQPTLEGVDAVRVFGRRMMAAGVRVAVDTTRVEQSGNLAFELARYTMMISRKDGTKVEERGKIVNVWRRQPNGEWKMAVHAPSNDPAL